MIYKLYNIAMYTSKEVEVKPNPRFERLVHLHIPKTAGTSLRSAFMDTYGNHNVLHFDRATGKAALAGTGLISNERPVINRLKATVYRNGLFKAALPLYTILRNIDPSGSVPSADIGQTPFKVLTGHFTGNQLRDWGVDDLPVVTVVRDPLERLWSQYNHWKRSNGKAFKVASGIPYNPSVSFEKYMATGAHDNYQSNMLGDIHPALVGAFDNLPQFTEALGIGTAETIPHLNKADAPDLPHIGRSAMAAFIEANAADYALYDSAQSVRG